MNQAQTIALYQPLLHEVAFRILKCKADAEDIVQETFIRWLETEQEKIQNTKAYLIRSVRNNCLNHLHTLRRKKEEYLETIDMSTLATKFREIDFSHLDLEAELSRAMNVLQHKLEPLERAVYLLKEVFDVDYASLQLTLNKKQEHCRQLLSRAKKKLSTGTTAGGQLEDQPNSWMDAFRKACDAGNPSGLVDGLKKDMVTGK